MSVVQQLPPLTCPYANKAGLVIMALGQTGTAQAKTGAVLYEVHLPLANGKFKKSGKALTLNEAGTAAAENEKSLGWDDLPALATPGRPAAPVKKAKVKPTPIEAGEVTMMTASPGEPLIVSIEPAETPAVVVAVAAPDPDPVVEPVAVSRPEGAKPERAQPKASERQPKKPAEKKPDPIVAAARAANRARFQ